MESAAAGLGTTVMPSELEIRSACPPPTGRPLKKTVTIARGIISSVIGMLRNGSSSRSAESFDSFHVHHGRLPDVQLGSRAG